MYFLVESNGNRIQSINLDKQQKPSKTNIGNNIRSKNIEKTTEHFTKLEEQKSRKDYINNLSHLINLTILIIQFIAVAIVVIIVFKDIHLLEATGEDADRISIHEINDEVDIFLPLSTACIFHDGYSPQDPDGCIPIMNNEDTGGIDNIFFKLRSDETVDTFSCELRDENNILLTLPDITNNPSDCKVDSHNIQMQYTNLPDGLYTFRVIATKIVIDNDSNIVTNERTGKSIPFRFFVNTGGGVSGGS